ncbi:phage minor tail protein L [Acinetobacter baumannii]|uniref:phage minor tail protein L n=1 Tax=Acinetobacter baumannii TaxID=470 RepID=UPI0015D4209F|nr:phage minor tail protein L [Acinetobacter baumannii]MBI1408647.1 phage minor tail protein L [Acinetobacter baumannii]MBI1429739.1 phage minor tail protein L [Acinetobacter baumannii]MDC4311991.1 phage minor tail protein L [Acinetobacter baumannii]MDI9702215.1 phage minor tail protein L [Acinetobacter baumannii]QLI39581.1 phage minor tail protein L [Acinetobacter baumannii]
MSLNSDFQKLYVDGLIHLYELDASSLGAGILRFHGHIAFQDWEKIYSSIGSEGLIGADTGSIGKIFDTGDQKVWNRNIIWQGQVFEPMALEVSGLEMRSDGKASAPTLSMANNIGGIQNAVSALCLQFSDFAGAKLKVITTLAKYLDAENFSQGNLTASNEAKEQLWYIEQKTSENAQAVTFELSNPIDFEGLKIPVRQISNYCHWCAMGNFRGEECQYTGAAMFTDKDEPTDNPALDRCSGRLSSCRIRNNEIRFGGFPASSLM